jgi:hypothetical protein
MIEQFASAALSSLLDIDLETSKTLSNKSSAPLLAQASACAIAMTK